MKKTSSWLKRSSGILLPVSSLPSKYGIGSFGRTARKWIDFLHEAKQSYWQILPLSPTGFGDSPYQSFSAFAGNPYFIEPDKLYEEGLLDKPDYENIKWGKSSKLVDYATLYNNREKILRKAFTRFKDDKSLDLFIDNNDWLFEYGLFMVIKSLNNGNAWTNWDEQLRLGNPGAIKKIKKEYADEIRFHAFIQYKFYSQWEELRSYANDKGVQIIGDIPIYVSLDSSDVWAYPQLYQLDKNKMPREISGCPPDSFAAGGQLWGNPLYDWAKMEKTGYKWWIKRFNKNFGLYDVVRLDHFRGLESYYAIPYGDETAERGVWKPGPGKSFIDAIKKNLPDAKIIAEDLGYLTKEVYTLLKYSGYPGMKITQYAFDNREAGDYLPHNYEKNSVVYPGTHDNDTLKGWIKTAPKECINDAMLYTGTGRLNKLSEAMIRLTLQSASYIAVIPMQDWLGLGSAGRINIPSTVGGNNWRLRLSEKDINPEIAGKIASFTSIYKREANTS